MREYTDGEMINAIQILLDSRCFTERAEVELKAKLRYFSERRDKMIQGILNPSA